MNKYLTQKQLLGRYAIPLLILGGTGVFLIFAGASNLLRPTNYKLSLLDLLSIFAGLGLLVLLVIRLWQFKATPIIVCPKCGRELSDQEIDYGFCLHCKQKLEEEP